MIKEKVSDPRYQVLYLPAGNPNKVLVEQEQEEGFLTKGFHCLVFGHRLPAFTQMGDQIRDLLGIARFATLE